MRPNQSLIPYFLQKKNKKTRKNLRNPKKSCNFAADFRFWVNCARSKTYFLLFITLGCVV